MHKTTAKQVWLYFIRSLRLGYGGSTTNLPIVLNTTKKSLLKSSYPQKNTCQIFLHKKILESKISNPKKSFDHPCLFEIWSTPCGEFEAIFAYCTVVSQTNKSQPMERLIQIDIVFFLGGAEGVN